MILGFLMTIDKDRQFWIKLYFYLKVTDVKSSSGQKDFRYFRLMLRCLK